MKSIVWSWRYPAGWHAWTAVEGGIRGPRLRATSTDRHRGRSLQGGAVICRERPLCRSVGDHSHHGSTILVYGQSRQFCTSPFRSGLSNV